MAATFITSRRSFMLALVASLILAVVAWFLPQTHMPLNFHAMIWQSIPVAGIWLLVVVLSAYRFGKIALWMLLGAPLTLYWPVWLAFHGIPACYWHGNCV